METISLTINSSWIVSYHWLISWAKVSRCKLEAKAHESRSWWVSGPPWDIMAQHFLGGCPKDMRQCVQVELHRSARTEAICSTVHTAPNWGKRIHNKSVSNLSNAAAAQSYKLVFSSRKQWMVLRWVKKCGAPPFLTCISEHLFPPVLGQYQQYHPELIGGEQACRRTGRPRRWNAPADKHSVTGRRLDRRIISLMAASRCRPRGGSVWSRHVKTAVELCDSEKRTGAACSATENKVEPRRGRRRVLNRRERNYISREDPAKSLFAHDFASNLSVRVLGR